MAHVDSDRPADSGGVSRLDLPGHDAVGLRAANPGPLTLSGTNSWVVGRDPAWVIDPGPSLEEHLDALTEELRRRGGLGGIALTHHHHDHDEAVEPLLSRCGGAATEVVDAATPGGGAAGAGPASAGAAGAGLLGERGADERFGELRRLRLPGHTPDHVVYLADGVAFSGDAVLGEGSVFIAPDPGALVAYLDGLTRLRERAPVLIAPGHGPVVVDPDAKLAEYLAHRAERERRLCDALDRGGRRVDDLLDAAWSEVPERLRFPAALTLAAHLDKLEGEGRLPAGVERPRWPLPEFPQI